MTLAYDILKDLFRGAFSLVKNRLTAEEKNILVQASATGEIRVLKVSVYGEWVRAGDVDLLFKNDPAQTAQYREAFERLCRRGLIRYESGHLYRLTGSGFAIARELEDKEKRDGQ